MVCTWHFSVTIATNDDKPDFHNPKTLLFFSQTFLFINIAVGTDICRFAKLSKTLMVYGAIYSIHLPLMKPSFSGEQYDWRAERREISEQNSKFKNWIAKLKYDSNGNALPTKCISGENIYGLFRTHFWVHNVWGSQCEPNIRWQKYN